jgi:hypothetical protein
VAFADGDSVFPQPEAIATRTKGQTKNRLKTSLAMILLFASGAPEHPSETIQ